MVTSFFHAASMPDSSRVGHSAGRRLSCSDAQSGGKSRLLPPYYSIPLDMVCVLSLPTTQRSIARAKAEDKEIRWLVNVHTLSRRTMWKYPFRASGHTLHTEPRRSCRESGLVSPTVLEYRLSRQAFVQPSIENPTITIGLAYHDDERVKVHEIARESKIVITLEPSFADQLALGNPS